jgi:hypothetical protein
MLDRIDNIFIFVCDYPFLILKRISSQTNHSLNLDISHIRRMMSIYTNNNTYIDTYPIPSYYHRIYTKIILEQSKNLPLYF